MTIEYLGDGNPDGTVLVKSATEKLGFYGGTPVAQQTVTVVGTTTFSTTLAWTRLNRLEAAVFASTLIASTS